MTGTAITVAARRSIFALALALALAWTVVPVTLAGEPMPAGATITVHVDFETGGSWSSSGSLVDAGTVVPLSQRFGSPLGPSPQWTAHEDILFTGQAGSFTIRQHTLLVDTSPLVSLGTSNWVVRSGTDAYLGLQGHGTATIEAHWDAGTLDILLIGQLDVDHSRP